ncbi:hypothetical protein FUA23_07025 [Neolewinella aurantiaca]|uniref:Uncharacterized protein n=1 Tax=Neolewinella aurantiaca TaxID=2602767 RepID=A0A5C7FG93_9BACT|nr:hypothetical protein [Neolewinella aurantiaca]TXF90264.1 hypothetical protein FUA23_07025 [Neolewinella aurantiaca]
MFCLTGKVSAGVANFQFFFEVNLGEKMKAVMAFDGRKGKVMRSRGSIALIGVHVVQTVVPGDHDSICEIS